MSEALKDKVESPVVPVIKKVAEPKVAQPEPRKMSYKEIELERKHAQEQELLREWQEESQMVRGIFNFKECPNGKLKFSFHKYKWDDIKTYELKDGELYELPLMVAKHLNTACWYPTYNYKQDERGLPMVSFNEKIRRTSFQNLDFVDKRDPEMRAMINRSPLSGLSVMGSALPQ